LLVVNAPGSAPVYKYAAAMGAPWKGCRSGLHFRRRPADNL